MFRTLTAIAVLVLAAGTATAQSAPTDANAELGRLRAEADRMTNLIDAARAAVGSPAKSRGNPTAGYIELNPGPADIAAQEKKVAELTAKLQAHRNAAHKALIDGNYGAAAAAASAAAGVDKLRKTALVDLAQLKAKQVQFIPPLRLTPPTVWSPTGSPSLEKKVDGLAKRLASLEARLARIEKLLTKLAQR